MSPAVARSPAERVAAYKKAVATAEMRNVRLIKSDFSMEGEGVSDDQKAWKRGYACDVAQTHFDAKRNLITGLVVADAWCRLARKKVISLKCRYIVAYDISGETDEAAAAQFVERVGKFAVYPYFRTHFSELTSQAGISLSPLPVLKEGARAIPKAREVPAPPKRGVS